ncbi:hypothetical protein HpDR66_11870 [Helicobacter pylori]
MNPPKKEKEFKKGSSKKQRKFKTKGSKKTPQKRGLKKGVSQRAKH